jgi:hypothetical protein
LPAIFSVMADIELLFVVTLYAVGVVMQGLILLVWARPLTHFANHVNRKLSNLHMRSPRSEVRQNVQ